MPADRSDTDALRAFRRNAVHVRPALRAVRESGERHVQVVDGYIQDPEWIERYRRLATPVRRAAMDSDRASLKRALASLEADYPTSAALRRARQIFDDVQTELESTVGLGGRKVTRAEMFRVWMDAAVFYDSREKQHAYDELVAAYGKAIESMSAELTERYGEAVLAADEAAAEALGEPIVLPPPVKTPPPPPEPTERGRWKRLVMSLFRRAED